MSTTDTLKLALEALEFLGNHYMGWPQQGMQAITTIKQALAEPVQSAKERSSVECVEPVAWMDVDENGTMYSLRYWSEPDNRNEVALYRAPPNVATPQPAPVQEPVTILPDGSAFGVMSFPLPSGHWLYAPNEYRDGEYEPIDLPKPILTHALRESVVAAVRYAVRGATMRGQETDFDPDAIVQNAVYALCGPYTTPPNVATPPAAPVQSAERVEPVAWWNGKHGSPVFAFERDTPGIGLGNPDATPLYTTPPAAQRQPLTDEQIKQIYTEQTGSFIDDSPWALLDFARAIEAAHGIKENT